MSVHAAYVAPLRGLFSARFGGFSFLGHSMDYAALLEKLLDRFGPLAAILAGIGYFLWRDRPGRKLADADSDGSVDAISEWKGIAQELRTANKELAERADAFARERNERVAELGKLQAQIAEMSALIKSQSEQLDKARGEIQRLTQEIAQLRGQR